MKRKLEQMAHIGPCSIDICPQTDFTRVPLTREQVHSLWKLCGPSAQRNLEHNPLWVVIVMAYYEGLAHGVRGLEALMEKENDTQP
jgi:hypothetical protein